jgi:acyl carrier protein/ubiquinone/menaquinone biosynthesis C-methylase UbiE
MVIGRTSDFTSSDNKMLQTLHCRMIYNAFSRVVSYSPEYQGMKRISIQDNGLEGYAKVKLEKSTSGLFCVHPFLQDCFLQVAGFVANVSDLCQFDEVLLATKVEEAQFLSQDISESDNLDVYTNLIMVDKENVIGDVYILSKTGNMVGKIGGAHFKKMRTPTLKGILEMSVRQSGQPVATPSRAVSPAVAQRSTIIKGTSSQAPQFTKGNQENQDFVVKVVADCLGVAENTVSNEASLIEMGIDSLMSIELIAKLQSFVPNTKLSSSLFMDCLTIGEVKQYLAALSPPTVNGTSIVNEHAVSIKNNITLSQIRGIIAEALGVEAAEIDPDTQLAELGVDSLMSIELRSRLQELTSNELPSNFLIDYSTLQSVYGYYESFSGNMSYSSVDSGSSIEQTEVQDYSRQDIRLSLRSLLASLLCVGSDEIKDSDSLADLGIDSLMSIELASKLSEDFGLTLASSDLMNYITFDNLASDIERISQKPERTVKSQVTVSSVSVTRSTEIVKPTTSKGQSNISSGIADVIEAMNSVQQLFPAKASETGLEGFINDIDPKQNQLVLRYILDAFSQLGCDLISMAPGTLIPPMNMILSEHARLKSRLFDILEWMDVINREPGNIYVRSNQDISNIPTADILLQDLCSRYPVFETDNLLLSKTGSKLADCITGRASPLEILFKDEEASNLMFKFYCDSPMFATAVILLNEMLQRLLSAPNDETIRIIEIGGGTGGTTAKILPILQKLNRKVKYTFTDISKAFVLKAKKKFAAYDFLDYTACNIEELPENFADGAVYDIVIATNVIHATQNIRHTLTNINRLLTKNGMLILSELTKDLYWFDLVFGLLSGWWHFTDNDVRNHAIMQPEVWREQLVSTGFHEVAWAQSSSSDIAVQRIIVGRKTLDGKQRVNTLNEPVSVHNGNHSPVDFLKVHAAINATKSSKTIQPKQIENTQFNAKNKLVTITATPPPADNYTVSMANLCQAYYTGMYLPVNAIRSHIYFEKVLDFDLNVEKFQKSVDISLSRHPILRSRVHNGQFNINPCSGNYVADEVIDLYGKQESEINEAIHLVRNQRLKATFGENGRHFWYCIIHINEQKSILVLDAGTNIRLGNYLRKTRLLNFKFKMQSYWILPPF